MASSSGSGTSSGSSLIHNSGSEENLQALLDQRKRKRMISNRESARRSRMRKQKHLDDLTAQVTQLRKENQHIITNLNITSQHYVTIEAENSILKAQVGELSHRLQSLNEIIGFLSASSGVFEAACSTHDFSIEPDSCFFNPLQMPVYINQRLMASADMFQDC